MSGMGHTPLNLHSILSAWDWSPFALVVLVALLAAGSWYLAAEWRLAARGRLWPRRRELAFLGGLLTVDLALQSPIATFTGSYFEAHVIQHLLLMVVAPALLALGAPSTLLLQSADRITKRRWLRVLRSPAFAALTHPVTVWLLYFGLMLVFFLGPLVNVAMDHMALMDALNVVFLLGGCLYWWPLVGLDPIVHWKMGYGTRMLTVLIGGPIETWLGIAIMAARSPIASMYTLSSTHAGGGMLWAVTELATLIGFVPIYVRWLRSEERLGRRLDRRSDNLSGSVPQEPLLRSGPNRGSARSAWEAAWLERTGAIPTQSGRVD